MAVEPEILAVAEQAGLNIEPLEAAATFTRSQVDGLRASLERSFPIETPGQICVVLSGSFARLEATHNSDWDSLVIVNELPDDLRVVKNIVREVDTIRREKGIGGAGQTGLFGEYAIAGELMGRIGLQSDSNVNMTRRLSLLTESVSVYNAGLRTTLIETILARYCDDYHEDSDREQTKPIRVPRFLLNDIVRYWRTLAVDFGAKQWSSIQDDWHLRRIKLLTSRKVLFAGSLASLFLVERACSDRETPYSALIEHLLTQVDKSPLARLMSAYGESDDQGKEGLRAILAAYSNYIEVLQRTESRNLLQRKAESDGSRASAIQSEVEEICAKIQDGLEQVFFSNGLFSELTARYAIF